MGVDFGKIGKIAEKVFDADLMDIRRNIEGKLQEVYTNVPCHVAYSSADNPDPASADIKPVIQSLVVHMPLWVDVRNDDYIVAKKMGAEGDLLAVYSGRCGNPVVSQGRKKVAVSMDAARAEEPSPVPPKNPAEISVSFLCEGEEICEGKKVLAAAGEAFEMDAPQVEGFEAKGCEVDGEAQSSARAAIPEAEGFHDVRFLYEKAEGAQFFRFVAMGLYTADDGALAKGVHLFAKIPLIQAMDFNGDDFLFCEDGEWKNSDSGKKFKVEVGSKVALFPDKAFAEVLEIVDRDKGRVAFIARRYEPSQEEADAPCTRWYD